MISLPARQEPPALTRTNELVLDQHEPGLKKTKKTRVALSGLLTHGVLTRPDILPLLPHQKVILQCLTGLKGPNLGTTYTLLAYYYLFRAGSVGRPAIKLRYQRTSATACDLT